MLTHWRAPFTGGNRARIPAGTVLVVAFDRLPAAPGFTVTPQDYETLENLLVPPEDRLAGKYSGYSASLTVDDIGDGVVPVANETFSEA